MKPSDYVKLHLERVKAKRERLRALMSDCPACVPEDCDDIPDEELDKWLKSHGEKGT